MKLFTRILTFVLVVICMSSYVSFSAEQLEDGSYYSPGYNPFEAMPADIIGSDDRFPVNQPANPPYRYIAYIIMECDCGRSFTGTGAMIGEYSMLTAAHNLYCPYCTVRFDLMTIYFGYESSSSYVAKTTVAWNYSDIYVDSGYDVDNPDPNSDCAVIKFDSRIGHYTGWFALYAKNDSNLVNSEITIAGYVMGDLYEDEGRVDSVSPNRIFYTLDTVSGQSGSPIFSQNQYIVGIHTRGFDENDLSADRINSGWRVTSSFIITMESLGYID